MQSYRAPWWLPGGNLQTIWAGRLTPLPALGPGFWQRERWATPDGDFVDVDQHAAAPGAPLLVMFHGLEGSSSGHYAVAMAHAAVQRGWAFAVPHFRGCSGELNRGPRAYHSGDFEEVGWILARLRAQHGGALFAVGISLGGNALLRWAQEAGSTAALTAQAVAAVSAPLDLAAAGQAIGRGFNRLAYTRMFLASMKPKALAKWQQHPGLFDRERVRQARTLFEFDDAFTAPVHGFKGTHDYWARASSKPHLHRIQIPALVVNAGNDPFVPGASLPGHHQVGKNVTLWQPRHGGHVGFPSGRFPGHLMTLPEQVLGWLHAQHTTTQHTTQHTTTP